MYVLVFFCYVVSDVMIDEFGIVVNGDKFGYGVFFWKIWFGLLF